MKGKVKQAQDLAMNLKEDRELFEMLYTLAKTKKELKTPPGIKKEDKEIYILLDMMYALITVLIMKKKVIMIK